MTPTRLVTLVCVAQVCAQIGAYTWPALLPGFITAWHITNGEAGWITGLFYAAYTVSVPFLVTLTDRIDPRSVYVTGVGLTVPRHERTERSEGNTNTLRQRSPRPLPPSPRHKGATLGHGTPHDPP